MENMGNFDAAHQAIGTRIGCKERGRIVDMTRGAQRRSWLKRQHSVGYVRLLGKFGDDMGQHRAGRRVIRGQFGWAETHLGAETLADLSDLLIIGGDNDPLDRPRLLRG